MRADGPPFRADHVGSLLRPPELLALRADVEAGGATIKALRALEDQCIRDAVAMQEELGLSVVTDGEFRRESFHGDFVDRLEGVEFKLFNRGEEGVAPFAAVVSAPIALPAGGIEVENFRFLNSCAAVVAKQTLPSPTMTHFRGGREAISREAYPELETFFADLARVYREEIGGLADAGCRYLQLDDTNLAYLCDSRMRDRVAARGEDLEQLPHDYARLINDSIRDRPDDMVVAVHLCRGNARSRWFAEGGYEPIADVLFNELDVDAFFLEFDDERSGDFAPLRFVPANKRIVLGLVTSKRGALEDADEIARRVDDAARYLDLDQLCLSPQCGFASAAAGNLLSIDEQKRKLAFVVEMAERIWA